MSGNKKSMKKRNSVSRALPYLVLVITLLASCSEKPCEGTLVLTNPIPDVTVAVGDTVYIDLANPPVFVSSEGRVSYDYQVYIGTLNANLNMTKNASDNNNFTLLLVIGRSVGVAVAELLPNDGCLENKTTFNINIIGQSETHEEAEIGERGSVISDQ
jgi:hypothetical protein